METLSGIADKKEYADVHFVVVLRFINGNSQKEFSEDGGETYKQVATYLPKGSKLKLVQDIKKETVIVQTDSGKGGCANQMDNCATAGTKEKVCKGSFAP